MLKWRGTQEAAANLLEGLGPEFCEAFGGAGVSVEGQRDAGVRQPSLHDRHRRCRDGLCFASSFRLGSLTRRRLWKHPT